MKLSHLWGFPGGSVVKNLAAKQKMWVRSLGQEDPLEKEMATHSKILAWAIPWTEELQSMGSQRVRHDLATEHPGTAQMTSFLGLLTPRMTTEVTFSRVPSLYHFFGLGLD